MKQKVEADKMKKILMITLMLVTVLAIAVPYAVAGCGACPTKKAVAKGQDEGIINSTCPVMGSAVKKNTPYKVEYQGKTIGFCCPSCIGMFNKNPEKYTAKLGLEPEKKGSSYNKKGSGY